MKKFLIENWKTNLLSIIAIGVIVLYTLNKITTEQLATIQGFIIAIGLAVSKDLDK